MLNNNKITKNQYPELHHLMEINNNTSNLSELPLINMSSNVKLNLTQVNLRKISKLRLINRFAIYKNKARKELMLGIYIPVTNIHYISSQLRKVIGKRILISSILKRRVNVTLIKRKSMLIKKINNINTYNNNIALTSDILLFKNNIIKKESNSKINTDNSIIQFKGSNSNIVLPKFLTLNNNWKNKLLNLNSSNRLTQVPSNLISGPLFIGRGVDGEMKNIALNIMHIKSRKMCSYSNLTGFRMQGSSALLTIGNRNSRTLHQLNKLEIQSELGQGSNNNYKDIIVERYAKISTLMNSLTKFYSEEANSQYLIYQFSKKNKYSFKVAENFIKLAFLSMGCLISKVMFSLVQDQKSEDYDSYYSKPQSKIIITIFYFCKSSHSKIRGRNKKNNTDLLTRFNIKLQFLVDVLAKIFKSDIQLNLIQLKKPQYNSNILAQYLGLKSYKYRFVKLVKLLFRRLHIEKPSNINAFSQISAPSDSHLIQGTGNLNTKYNLYPSFLAGIRIRLGGRTFKQKVIPRRTVQLIQKGSLNRANVNLIEKARFTGKTRRGSYSFTVTLGHVF